MTPHNLPFERTSFVGREAELSEGQALLRAGEDAGRLLTIVGTGGAGKTRFALQLAARALHQHPDGVWFVDLAPLTDPTHVPFAVASVLGIREQRGIPLTRTLAEHLGERHTLIVLDNCEHVLEPCRGLAHELRAASPGLVVLATSREPLGLNGEQVYPLPPLATPSPSEGDEPAALGRHASVALFVDRAQSVLPPFALDASTARAVKEICRAMDGLPLAIELAAARVRMLTVNEIATRLDRLLALLRAPSGSTSRRHATMRATLEWSVQALGADEQRAFRTLAVFASGWDLAGAAAVLDLDELDALDRIDGLVSRSLVIAESGVHESRYRFLEPVRQYAAELLEAADEKPAALRRLVSRFVELAEQAGPALLGPEQSRWLDRIGLDHENLAAAGDPVSNSPAPRNARCGSPARCGATGTCADTFAPAPRRCAARSRFPGPTRRAFRVPVPSTRPAR
jgi:non-specific serine/threonine protein kinase